jgi:2-keto-3-deoxy-L-rhamnonate aldolase RhmA/quercetin dioxygenase-like cupin family protein
MKTPAIRKLRQKLATNQPVYGLWVTLESPSIVEMAVGLGLDWIVIDAEHGHLDWKEIVEHLRATVRSDTVALVRLAECNIGLIKRALDIGADGVLLPWMESAEQLRQAVAFAHYPPDGVRGIGAERATCWGQCFVEHTEEANENVLVIPIIESVKGGRNIREMLRVEGVEMFFFGPADFSSSAGFKGQWEGPGVAEQILGIKDQIVASGKHCGVIATGDANLAERRGQGFRMLGLGLDSGLLLRSLRGTLASVGRDRKINPLFQPESAPPPATPMDRPPENFRPDRPEVMNDPGTGKKIEIDRGVVFECLVGAHNQAKNLTTGIVRFDAGAQLAYHRHTFTESVTLLEGSAVLEVEGRRYLLSPMDNVVIPPGLAHFVKNASMTREAVFHIAMPTDAPSRELVEKFFSRKTMADDASGSPKPGLERVNRFSTAKRFEAGAGATFIDFFNEDLVPGIEMSGGYGVFKPGGRLPAHIHDFDESICIVQGDATCVVEGRKYSMSGYSTALQPRGRVHYFINESDGPMAMIWVYAGPRPERLVVDERNATSAGNPWR